MAHSELRHALGLVGNDRRQQWERVKKAAMHSGKLEQASCDLAAISLPPVLVFSPGPPLLFPPVLVLKPRTSLFGLGR